MADDTRVKISAALSAEVKDMLCADIQASIPSALSAEIDGVTGRGVAGVTLENGNIVFVMTDGDSINIGPLPEPEIPIASAEVPGIVRVGGNLTIDENGRLSADVSQSVSQGDTKPVSGGAVYDMVGNIETALSVL